MTAPSPSLGVVGGLGVLGGASSPLASPSPTRAEVASLLARGRHGDIPDAATAPGAQEAQGAPRTVSQAQALGQQFEALLLRQLVEAMSATVPDSGLMGPSSGPKTLYQDMVTDALATQVARSGGLGIARLLAPTMANAYAGPTSRQRAETTNHEIPTNRAALAGAGREK